MAANSYSGTAVVGAQEAVDRARLRWVGPLTVAVAVIRQPHRPHTGREPVRHP